MIPSAGHLRVNQRFCSGCGLCEVACTLFHGGICQPSSARIYVEKDHLNLQFVPHVCAQCRHPACYESCAQEAVRIDGRTGARYIDSARCIGCGDCAAACPLMPHAEVLRKTDQNGRIVYVKCDLCRDRSEGPLCVDICPRDALKFRIRKSQ
ncbi:MAG: 4Fe-4S dicluster domain-containing protein [Spirochaetaceae bacterium]|nr:MAG: 4Fe-4S dicluster domain-containing protein [Spirochaetaceae bacterium]